MPRVRFVTQAVRLALIVAALLTAACGKPPSQEGFAGAVPVQAVVAEVTQGPIEESLFLVGNLVAKESIDLRSEIGAEVTFIGFEEGAAVKEGQELFRLDDNKLRAQVAEARARYDQAKHEFDRGEVLLNKESISRQQFDRIRFELAAAEAALKLSQERLRDAIILAPFAGRMDRRSVSLGQYVNAGELLSALVQTDPLHVEFNVPERYLGQLAIGQEIRIQSVAYPGESFTGKVSFIAPKLDERSRTILMKAEIANTDGRLKPGMFANLELVFQARDDAIVIPEQAVSYRGDQAAVVIMNEQGKAEYRNIEVGLRLSGVAEVISGLRPGERIVVEGFQKIGPGSQIIVSPKSERYGVAPTAMRIDSQPSAG